MAIHGVHESVPFWDNSEQIGKSIQPKILRAEKDVFPQEYFVYFKGKRRISGAKDWLKAADAFVRCCPQSINRDDVSVRRRQQRRPLHRRNLRARDRKAFWALRVRHTS